MKKLLLVTNEYYHLVDIDDIIYCKSDNAYTEFYLRQQEKIRVSDSLKHFENKLQDYQFVRIHQSYLVNTSCITKIQKQEGLSVILENGRILPVSSRKKKSLMHLLKKNKQIQS